MNVKKADKVRYWLAFLVKDFGVDDVFKPDALHITIIPWFVTELDEADVIKSFYQKFSEQPATEVIVGKQEVFKNKRKISINLINNASAIWQLHKRALDWFAELEARWAVKNPHVGKEFIAHIRRRKGHNFSPGDRLNITSLSLVKATRRGDDLRTVIAKVDMK